MRKKIEWKWEKLDDVSRRVKVIGGWLVQAEVLSNKGPCAVSTVFVADRDHEWHIIEPIEHQAAQPSVKADDFQPKK